MANRTSKVCLFFFAFWDGLSVGIRRASKNARSLAEGENSSRLHHRPGGRPSPGCQAHDRLFFPAASGGIEASSKHPRSSIVSSGKSFLQFVNSSFPLCVVFIFNSCTLLFCLQFLKILPVLNTVCGTVRKGQYSSGGGAGHVRSESSSSSADWQNTAFHSE